MPLRVRLTLWYGTALALILIIFSTILYVVTARSLRDAADQSRVSHCHHGRRIEDHEIRVFTQYFGDFVHSL